MAMESRVGFFARSALVALAYGLAYAGLRAANLAGAISEINCVPMAALRFTCLLFVPVRYWPALVVGETIPVVYQHYLRLDPFGMIWMWVASVPPILYVAPIVHLICKQVPDFEKRLAQNIGRLLLCMFVVSLVVGLHDMLNYGLSTLASGEPPIPLWLYGIRLAASHYVTILSITPLALWLAEGMRQAIGQRKSRLSTLVGALQEMPWRATAGLLLIITSLAGIGYAWGQSIHVIAVCSLVAVLVVAAWWHGWQFGWRSPAQFSAAANLGIIALITTHDDPLTIFAQCMIAALMTFALLLGARTTAARGLAQDLPLAEDAARLAELKTATIRKMVRQELFANERYRLAYATMLDQLFDKTRQAATRVLHDVRTALSSSAIAKHYREFQELQDDHESLATGLSPQAWIQLGGPSGPIARALASLGASCKIDLPSPSDLMRLSTELSIAIHRMSCEAVAYLVKHAYTKDVRIAMAVHGGEGERPIVEVTFESLGKILVVEPPEYTPFLLGMGAFGLSAQGLDLRAQLYDGYLEVKRLSDGHLRLRFRVIDPPAS